MDPSARFALTQSMLAHVCECLGAAGLNVFVVSSASVGVSGTRVISDPGRGLNAALQHACGVVGAPLLICMADLAWLQRQDVLQFLDETGDVVIAPTRDGGTGAMALRKGFFPFEFGEDSALRNSGAARLAGLRTRVVSSRGFDRDLDSPSDLARPTGFT